jgi:hypothetical protein
MNLELRALNRPSLDRLARSRRISTAGTDDELIARITAAGELAAPADPAPRPARLAPAA